MCGGIFHVRATDEIPFLSIKIHGLDGHYEKNLSIFIEKKGEQAAPRFSVQIGNAEISSYSLSSVNQHNTGSTECTTSLDQHDLDETEHTKGDDLISGWKEVGDLEFLLVSFVYLHCSVAVNEPAVVWWSYVTTVFA